MKKTIINRKTLNGLDETLQEETKTAVAEVLTKDKKKLQKNENQKDREKL